MTHPIAKKIELLEKKFFSCKTSEEKYLTLIEMGKKLPPFKEDWKTESNRVLGCQSILYLHTELKDNKVFFHAYSDALISKGIAALLLSIYNDEEPKIILNTPPNFLKTTGIFTSLSPNRSNGLIELLKKMITAAHLYKKTSNS